VLTSNRKAGGRELAHSGTTFAWLGGGRSPRGGAVTQTVTIPTSCRNATLTFWRHIDTTERRSKGAVDKLTVKLASRTGAMLATLATYSNLDAANGYRRTTLNLSGHAGQTVTVSFNASERDRGGLTTDFCIDDASLGVA
jgi:hypothetical protein